MTVRLTESHVVAVVRRLTVARLHTFVEAGCIAPAEVAGERVFGEAELARLELLCELADDFGLDTEALALVMSLIDQLHGIRHEMRSLAHAIGEQPDEVRARIRAAYLRGRAG
ncbi:MAG TPA: chaperone modulator CbpM [Thermohalobaculum sp.]|nr:chaperone modulator CbpM [Thermohalobaculum sp.]